MSDDIPTPTERIATALEQLVGEIERQTMTLYSISDALDDMNERQEAALRERYTDLLENAVGREAGSSADVALRRFRRAHADIIRRWEREDAEQAAKTAARAGGAS